MKHATGEWTKLEDAPWAKDGRMVLGWWRAAVTASYDAERGFWVFSSGVCKTYDPDYVAEIHPPEVVQ